MTEAGRALVDDLKARWPERGRRQMRRTVEEALPVIETEAVAMEREAAATLADIWHKGAEHDPGPWRLCVSPECTAIATLLDHLEPHP